MASLNFHIWKLYEEEELVRALFRYSKTEYDRTERFRKISKDVSERFSGKKFGKNDCFAKYKVFFGFFLYIYTYLLIIFIRN